MGIFVGYEYAIMKEDLTKREFIKGGDIIFLFTMQGRFCEVLSESNFILNKLGRIMYSNLRLATFREHLLTNPENFVIDISGLLQKNSLPCPKVTVKNFNTLFDAVVKQGQCATR